MSVTFTKQNKNKVSKALEGKISFKKLTSEELHQFVQNYNYDDAREPLKWIAEQKQCDKGTALCLYWHLEPEFYCETGSSNAGNEDYEIIKDIENRFLSGFYQNEQLSFDPQSTFINDGTNTSCIPGIMLEKTKGTPFEKLSVEFAFLRNPNEKERKVIDKKIKDAIAIIQKSNPAFVYDDNERTINAIIDCVEFWKGKESGKIKINNLSFLWLDCVRQKYQWDWVMWDWETGANFFISNEFKSLACPADTIINHTIDSFQPSKIILDLYRALKGANRIDDINDNPYTGIGLLFSSEHLNYYP